MEWREGKKSWKEGEEEVKEEIGLERARVWWAERKGERERDLYDTS